MSRRRMMMGQGGPDYAKMYLTFKALESGTFYFRGQDLQYSLDEGATWTTLPSQTNTPTVQAGSMILWKADITPEAWYSLGYFRGSADFEVYGNVMSIVNGDSFYQTTPQVVESEFEGLFVSNTHLISAMNLVLPAMTLAYDCYYGMFDYCTNMLYPPKLPATTLGEWCYCEMFRDCYSLQYAPELPVMNLAEGCYYCMFVSCESLTEAPILTATTLAPLCYDSMFYSCTSLNRIECYATDISATDCLNYWVRDVAATGTFVKASGVAWPSGDSGIPTGWTVTEV